MRLLGTCNQCGRCCEVPDARGGTLRCEHLAVTGDIGQPEATRCDVYARRRDGMEVAFRDATGTVRAIGRCLKGPHEAGLIVARGFGRGCSLEIEDRAAVPVGTFIRKEA